MKTYAVLSDIHGNKHALLAVFEDIESKYPNIDGYFLAGDYIDYGAFPNEVLNLLLKQTRHKILASIIGNHDVAIFENDCSRFRTEHGKKSFEWNRNIVNMKLLKEFDQMSSYKDISVFHGSDNDIWENIFPKDKNRLDALIDNNKNSNIIIVGHSHLQFLVMHNGKFILNPGSVGQPRNGNKNAQYSIIIKNAQNSYNIMVESVEYDIRKAASAIYENSLPKFLATRLFLGI